ncbi:unnamed protein product [Coccothraustes coccothraustes]
MVQAARGPGPALQPSGPPLCRAGARSRGPVEPRARAGRPRPVPPPPAPQPGAASAQRVTLMPFPGSFLRSYAESAPLQLPRVSAVIGDGLTEKSLPRSLAVLGARSAFSRSECCWDPTRTLPGPADRETSHLSSHRCSHTAPEKQYQCFRPFNFSNIKVWL